MIQPTSDNEVLEPVDQDESATDSSPVEGQAESPDSVSEPTSASSESKDPAGSESSENAASSSSSKSKSKSKTKPKPKSKAKKPAEPPPSPPPPEVLEGAIEALLLTAGEIIKDVRIRDVLGLPSVDPVRAALESISKRWAEADIAVELERVAGGVRVVTRPAFAEYVARLNKRVVASDTLSKTQLETLSIVAYKQPVPRAEVERIRGVQSGESLRALLERQLVKVVGRSDQPGRPMLYGTTRRFLASFGLHDLKDLPSAKDLKRL